MRLKALTAKRFDRNMIHNPPFEQAILKEFDYETAVRYCGGRISPWLKQTSATGTGGFATG